MCSEWFFVYLASDACLLLWQQFVYYLFVFFVVVAAAHRCVFLELCHNNCHFPYLAAHIIYIFFFHNLLARSICEWTFCLLYFCYLIFFLNKTWQYIDLCCVSCYCCWYNFFLRLFVDIKVFCILFAQLITHGSQFDWLFLMISNRFLNHNNKRYYQRKALIWSCRRGYELIDKNGCPNR